MTRDTAGGREEEGALPYVLGLSVALPLAVVVSRLDAGVPRKARSPRPRAEPAGWWASRLPVPLVKEGKKNSLEEEVKSPRPQPLSVCLGLGAQSPPDPDAAAERPAKRARWCVQCGSAETPQWRSGPVGPSTLCNACGIRLRAVGALREVEEQRPPPATPRKAAAPALPPESPASESSPDSPICQRRAPLGDVYLVRKQPKRERRAPRRDVSPPPAIYLVKKKKPSKKPWRPRRTGQRCLHCGTTSTPQWREGPLGRHTLCNACGVRYRQGRLLPEYRPAASPTFVRSEHASRHREVLQLHRRQQGNTDNQTHRKQPPKPVVDDSLLDWCVGGTGDAAESDKDDKNNVFPLRREPPAEKDLHPPTPLHRPLPQPVDDDPRTGGSGTAAGCDDHLTSAPSTLDSLLLDGPSAPLIVDCDEFLVS
jgi:GATA-binding protein, other eukaryote